MCQYMGGNDAAVVVVDSVVEVGGEGATVLVFKVVAFFLLNFVSAVKALDFPSSSCSVVVLLTVVLIVVVVFFVG